MKESVGFECKVNGKVWTFYYDTLVTKLYEQTLYEPAEYMVTFVHGSQRYIEDCDAVELWMEDDDMQEICHRHFEKNV